MFDIIVIAAAVVPSLLETVRDVLWSPSAFVRQLSTQMSMSLLGKKDRSSELGYFWHQTGLPVVAN